MPPIGKSLLPKEYNDLAKTLNYLIPIIGVYDIVETNFCPEPIRNDCLKLGFKIKIRQMGLTKYLVWRIK